jgi:hypothetical protein
MQYTKPNEPGPGDPGRAAATKKTTLIMTPGGLLRVTGHNGSGYILTKKDWRKFVKAIKEAYRGKQAAIKAADKAKKAKKKNCPRTSRTGTVVDSLGAENNDPLSGW